MRQLVLLAIVVGALSALLWARPAQTPAGDAPQLSYLTTAHQLGVVAYRDPPGAISPDGKRFAYAEGRFIRVIPVGGGAPITLAPGEGQIRSVAWQSNQTVIGDEGGTSHVWWTYDVASGQRRPLWDGRADSYYQLAWNRDGTAAAALMNTSNGPALVRVPSTGSNPEATRLSRPGTFPAFMADGMVACIAERRITMPCGGAKKTLEPDVDVIGPIAFSASHVYFASPAGNGMVAFWTADLQTLKAHRLSSFARDAYGPSIGGNAVVFKTQTYRTFLADVAVDGGATRQLPTFQSETPSYHPAQQRIAFTYGTWRRILDDGKYPAIAQDIGTVDVSKDVPADAPGAVIAKSDSEDQAMTWSPNGKWIAFHSHREMSDDVWLRPADLSTVALAKAEGAQQDKRITFLGRGAEVGWPRWSPDGKTVLLDGARKSDRRSVIYVIGVDQESGAVTSDLREVRAERFDAEFTHAEWLGSSNTIVALAKTGPGQHAIVSLAISGGKPAIIHRFATEHDFSGLGVSPDGRVVVFAAPAADGYFQIFKKAVSSASGPVQLTTDPSNKTQPAWSPDGARIAFTVWSYDASFWSFPE